MTKCQQNWNPVNQIIFTILSKIKHHLLPLWSLSFHPISSRIMEMDLHLWSQKFATKSSTTFIIIIIIQPRKWTQESLQNPVFIHIKIEGSSNMQPQDRQTDRETHTHAHTHRYGRHTEVRELRRDRVFLFFFIWFGGTSEADRQRRRPGCLFLSCSDRKLWSRDTLGSKGFKVPAPWTQENKFLQWQAAAASSRRSGTENLTA